MGIELRIQKTAKAPIPRLSIALLLLWLAGTLFTAGASGPAGGQAAYASDRLESLQKKPPAAGPVVLPRRDKIKPPARLRRQKDANAGRQTWVRTFARPGTLTFTGNGAIYAFRMHRAADGGLYLLAHTSAEIPSSTYDSCIMKVTAEGVLEWQRTFRKSQSQGDNQFIRSIYPTVDGGVIAGCQCAEGLGAMKFLPDGNVEWQQLYSSDGHKGYFADLQQTEDGGYLLLGSITSSETTGGSGDRDILLVKLDASGEPVWQRTYDGQLDEQPKSFLQEADGDILICGSVQGIEFINAGSLFLLRLTSSGDVEWQECYGGNNLDIRAFEPTNDGGAILAGMYYEGDFDLTDGWAMRISAEGAVQWARVYHGDYYESLASIHQTPDGGFIAAGQRNCYGLYYPPLPPPPNRALILKLTSNGEIEWQRRYGLNEEVKEGERTMETDSKAMLCAGGGVFYIWGGIDCARALPGGVRSMLIKTSAEAQGAIERLPGFSDTSDLESRPFSPEPAPFVVAPWDTALTVQDLRISVLDLTITGGLLSAPPVEAIVTTLMKRSLALLDYTNELSWQANQANDDLQIVKYRIYSQGPLPPPLWIVPDGLEKLEEVDGRSLQYNHAHVKKGGAYFYSVWSVTADGGEGIPFLLTYYPPGSGGRP